MLRLPKRHVSPAPGDIYMHTLGPAMLIAVAGFAVVVMLQHVSSRQLDAEADRYSRQIMGAAIQQMTEEIRTLVYDYSYWTDSVRRLVEDPDAAWAADNIGVYWHETFNTSASFAVSADERTTFGFVDGEAVRTEVGQYYGPVIGKLIRQTREQTTGLPSPVGAFVRTKGSGEIEYVSVAPISHEAAEERQPVERRGLLVGSKRIDEARIAGLVRYYSFEELQLTDMPAAADSGLVSASLAGVDGRPVAYLTWRPDRPSVGLTTSLMLPMLAVALIVLVAMVLLIRHVAGLARTLAESQGAVNEANAARSRFLAQMSHELRTPLNAIMGFSDILEREMFGSIGQPVYRDYARDINSSATHLLGLINDILDLSKVEAGKMELHPRPLNLDEVIRDSLTFVRTLEAQRRISITVERHARSRILHADPRAARQILTNLLSNAVKFTEIRPGRTPVTLSVRDAMEPGWPEAGIAITVGDTGPGMTETQLAQAMEPFSQVGVASFGAIQGTGLGLPLAQRLIELHGGRLITKSMPGQGTEMTVVFPPAGVAPARPGAPAPAVTPPATGAVRPGPTPGACGCR